MRAAIATVTVLAAIAMIIQHGSTCRITLNVIKEQGRCIVQIIINSYEGLA